MSAADLSLQRALDDLAPAGVVIGYRLIGPGDENALSAEEAESISSTPERRRASGAARVVARELLGRLGFSACPIPKDASGVPLWPRGIIGSLAHDDAVAVAALARSDVLHAIGIDIEPALPLPVDLADLIAAPHEQARIAVDPLFGRLLFAAKEAVYKAAYPLDRLFLEFSDIEVDLAAGKAVTRTGRALSLRHCVASHIVVLAFA